MGNCLTCFKQDSYITADHDIDYRHTSSSILLDNANYYSTPSELSESFKGSLIEADRILESV